MQGARGRSLGRCRRWPAEYDREAFLCEHGANLHSDQNWLPPLARPFVYLMLEAIHSRRPHHVIFELCHRILRSGAAAAYASQPRVVN